MLVKDLILKLKEFPEDMEVVLEDGGTCYIDDLEFHVVPSLLNESLQDKINPRGVYLKGDNDDYWNFQYKRVNVLVIY